MNKDKVKFISISADLLSIVSSIITLLPLIAGIITDVYILYALFAILLCILIIVLLYRKEIAKALLKKIMNLTCPDKIYKLKNKEVIYEFISREEMRHEKKFDVEVLHDGFTGIDDKFKWTGDGTLVPKAKCSSQEIELLDQKFGMQCYKLKFHSKRFSRHDDVEQMAMEITDIKDPEGKSSLHLSSGVFAVTDCMVLRVVLCDSLKPKNIRFLEYIHYSDDEHYSCSNGTVTINERTGKKEIIWTIKKPFYGGRYMIDWDFE